MQTRRDDRSLGELFGDLVRDMGILVRQEVGLARTELSYKASRMGPDLALMAAGGLVAYAGLLAILAALIIVLAAAGMPWWLAALIVGVIVAAVGAVLVQRGLAALKRVTPDHADAQGGHAVGERAGDLMQHGRIPEADDDFEQTTVTVREDIEFTRAEMRSTIDAITGSTRSRGSLGAGQRHRSRRRNDGTDSN